MMRSIIVLSLALLLVACKHEKEYSGNPIVEGWYADPEGVVFDQELQADVLLELFVQRRLVACSLHAGKQLAAKLLVALDALLGIHVPSFRSDDRRPEHAARVGRSSLVADIVGTGISA